MPCPEELPEIGSLLKLEDEDDDVVKAHKEWLSSRLRSFMNAGNDINSKAVKLERSSALKQLLAVDGQLRLMTGAGFEQFVITRTPKRKDLL